MARLFRHAQLCMYLNVIASVSVIGQCMYILELHTWNAFSYGLYWWELNIIVCQVSPGFGVHNVCPCASKQAGLLCAQS